MEVQWTYLGGEPLDILDEGKEDPPGIVAVRREWWYDPSNTYVYQARQKDGSWGPVINEHEKEPLPHWVEMALLAEAIGVVVGSRWRHVKRGSEYEVSELRTLQCGRKREPSSLMQEGPFDGDILVCYDSTDPACPPQYRSWARPLSEFLLRFEKIV